MEPVEEGGGDSSHEVLEIIKESPSKIKLLFLKKKNINPYIKSKANTSLISFRRNPNSIHQWGFNFLAQCSYNLPFIITPTPIAF